ncbi:MAG: hypothetical protein DMF84_09125 [Acidobacteria bacterium]|nr:MAG: hypothetical protein DMF84_09125 [Acidobacteriota bacterium]
MNEPENPNRSTSTETLWLIGIAGGVVVAVAAFYAGGDDAEETRRLASSFGAWGIRLLLLGVIFAGGWSALRRKAK